MVAGRSQDTLSRIVERIRRAHLKYVFAGSMTSSARPFNTARGMVRLRHNPAWVVGRSFRRMATIVDQHRTFNRSHYFAILINSLGLRREQSPVPPARDSRLAGNVYSLYSVSARIPVRRLDVVPSRACHRYKTGKQRGQTHRMPTVIRRTR
jgi:hypothetical protein